MFSDIGNICGPYHANRSVPCSSSSTSSPPSAAVRNALGWSRIVFVHDRFPCSPVKGWKLFNRAFIRTGPLPFLLLLSRCGSTSANPYYSANWATPVVSLGIGTGVRPSTVVPTLRRKLVRVERQFRHRAALLMVKFARFRLNWDVRVASLPDVQHHWFPAMGSSLATCPGAVSSTALWR